MELHWADGRVALDKPDDFKAFKVVVTGGGDRYEEVVRDLAGTARFEGRQLCWVSQAGLRSLAGLSATGAWLAGMEAMVAKARPHGWIDEATGAVRAHVEWR